jgi:hypothetical protein
MWVRARAIGLLAMSLWLLGMPAAALADSGRHPTPDPRLLWRVYPLGTQRLATPPGTRRLATGINQHSAPLARSANGDALRIGLWEMLAVAALLSVLAAMAPIALRRGRSGRPRVATGGAAVAELTEPLRSARRELIDSRPARLAGPAPTRDETIVGYAAAYAASSHRGERAPLQAVRAIVPLETPDPAAYAKRIIAEARRRDLLTSHGRGRAGGELTPKALALLERAHVASHHPASPLPRSPSRRP